MKHKDKGEQLSKEGCGRVVMNKNYGVVCSYTMESSIFSSAYSKSQHKAAKSEEKNIEFAIVQGNNKTYGFQPLQKGSDKR